MLLIRLREDVEEEDAALHCTWSSETGDDDAVFRENVDFFHVALECF